MKRIYLILFFTTLLIGSTYTAMAQSIYVSGQIKDSGLGEPLMGVNIVEVDANGRYLNGTITDINGNYIVKVSSGTGTIQVSMLGFEKQLVKINKRARIDITLEETSTQLGDITIVGEKMSNDGVTTIRDQAVAVGRIEMKEMKSSMTSSVEEMLQGRLGNVDITSMSGDPGAGLNIRIRGTATLNSKNSPLIVVNGIPYDTEVDESFNIASADVEKFGNLIDVAPEDIESIEVLKDAGATAIWGSKAANGVLMIKTKRGTRSKPVFEYTFKFTQAHEPNLLPMLDGSDYSMLIAEEKYNTLMRENFLVDKWPNKEISYNPDWLGNEYWNYAQNTNWIKEITDVANTQQHFFAVKGGGEKSAYKVSVGYLDEGGTTVGTGLKKINLSTAFDYNISTKLKFNTDIMYTRYDQDNNYDYEDNYYTNEKSLRTMAYRKSPNQSVYERDSNNVVYPNYFTPSTTLQGSAQEIPNPVAFANLAGAKRYKDNVRAGFTLNYVATDKIILNTILTLDVFDTKMEKFLPYKAIGANYYSESTNKAVNEFTNKTSLYSMTKIIYKPIQSALHDLVFLGQFDAEGTNTRFYKKTTSLGFSPYETSTVGDKVIVSQDSWATDFRSLGFFANATYKFNDKYIVTLGAKVEGNSKYSPESRWGVFPATSLAWRVSEESFLKNLEFINDFKIRGSWGISGNTPGDNYLYFNEYDASNSYNYMGIPGVRPTNMELTALQWENIEQLNIGFSFYGIKNRLNVEFDVYDKTTHDLYLVEWDNHIPSQTGFTNYATNEGTMSNRGIETSIDYKVIERKDFTFSFNFNISHNENMVIDLPSNFQSETGVMTENGEYKTKIVAGKPMGAFYGYNYLGGYSDLNDTYVKDANGDLVYEIGSTVPMRMIHTENDGGYYEFKAGDAKYEDRNHDGKIDELDIIYLGNTNPIVMGGFGPRASYKGFTVNVFLYYRVGNEIINQTRMDTEKMYNFDNQSTATNSRWRSEGDETDMPRALFGEGYNWLGSSRFVEDGSFIRFKSASITYDFPKSFAQKINLKELKMYITGYNMYTWSNYSGQDPEVGMPSRPDQLPKDYSRTPPSIRYTLGVSIVF
ncbi:MAG: SusC/RagA family TonB-linked outer membrane protein [Salinivirgaceae bacterium]